MSSLRTCNMNENPKKVLASFGICRQAIIKPQKTWSWTILQNITMEPYFMLYGEVYAADIDPCTPENAEKEWCKPGAWFVPVMMTIFLLGSFSI